MNDDAYVFFHDCTDSEARCPISQSVFLCGGPGWFWTRNGFMSDPFDTRVEAEEDARENE